MKNISTVRNIGTFIFAILLTASIPMHASSQKTAAEINATIIASANAAVIVAQQAYAKAVAKKTGSPKEISALQQAVKDAKTYADLIAKIATTPPANLSEVGLIQIPAIDKNPLSNWDESGYKVLNSDDYQTMSRYGTLDVDAGKNYWDKVGSNPDDTKHLRTIKFSNKDIKGTIVTKTYQCGIELKEPSDIDLSVWLFDPAGYNADQPASDRVATAQYGPAKHFNDYGLGLGRTISIINPTTGKTHACTPLTPEQQAAADAAAQATIQASKQILASASKPASTQTAASTQTSTMPLIPVPTPAQATGPVPLSSVGLFQGWDEDGYLKLYSNEKDTMIAQKGSGKGHWDAVGINDPNRQRTIKFQSGNNISKSYKCTPALREPSAQTFSTWTFDPNFSGYFTNPNDQAAVQAIGTAQHFKQSGLNDGRTISIKSPTGATYTCTPVPTSTPALTPIASGPTPVASATPGSTPTGTVVDPAALSNAQTAANTRLPGFDVASYLSSHPGLDPAKATQDYLDKDGGKGTTKIRIVDPSGTNHDGYFVLTDYETIYPDLMNNLPGYKQMTTAEAKINAMFGQYRSKGYQEGRTLVVSTQAAADQAATAAVQAQATALSNAQTAAINRLPGFDVASYLSLHPGLDPSLATQDYLNNDGGKGTNKIRIVDPSGTNHDGYFVLADYEALYPDLVNNISGYKQINNIEGKIKALLSQYQSNGYQEGRIIIFPSQVAADAAAAAQIAANNRLPGFNVAFYISLHPGLDPSLATQDYLNNDSGRGTNKIRLVDPTGTNHDGYLVLADYEALYPDLVNNLPGYKQMTTTEAKINAMLGHYQSKGYQEGRTIVFPTQAAADQAVATAVQAAAAAAQAKATALINAQKDASVRLPGFDFNFYLSLHPGLDPVLAIQDYLNNDGGQGTNKIRLVDPKGINHEGYFVLADYETLYPDLVNNIYGYKQMTTAEDKIKAMFAHYQTSGYQEGRRIIFPTKAAADQAAADSKIVSAQTPVTLSADATKALAAALTAATTADATPSTTNVLIAQTMINIASAAHVPDANLTQARNLVSSAKTKIINAAIAIATIATQKALDAPTDATISAATKALADATVAGATASYPAYVTAQANLKAAITKLKGPIATATATPAPATATETPTQPTAAQIADKAAADKAAAEALAAALANEIAQSKTALTQARQLVKTAQTNLTAANGKVTTVSKQPASTQKTTALAAAKHAATLAQNILTTAQALSKASQLLDNAKSLKKSTTELNTLATASIAARKAYNGAVAQK